MLRIWSRQIQGTSLVHITFAIIVALVCYYFRHTRSVSTNALSDHSCSQRACLLLLFYFGLPVSGVKCLPLGAQYFHKCLLSARWAGKLTSKSRSAGRSRAPVLSDEESPSSNSSSGSCSRSGQKALPTSQGRNGSPRRAIGWQQGAGARLPHPNVDVQRRVK